jgi:hypothetical protein
MAQKRAPKILFAIGDGENWTKMCRFDTAQMGENWHGYVVFRLSGVQQKLQLANFFEES